MKKNLTIIDFLTQIPWWASISLSIFFYVLLKYMVPYFEAQATLVNEVQVSLGPIFAPYVALALLAPITLSIFNSRKKKKLHDLKDQIQAIQELPWQELKDLVAEIYRCNGYIIMENSTFTNDPSVDIFLRKGANLYLLQCRYWLNRKLGLREVKNLFSLMHAKQASGVFLLATGIFSNEARNYAAGKPINLIDGIELVEMLDKINSTRAKEILN